MQSARAIYDLRSLLALCFGACAFATTLLTAAIVENDASKRLEQALGAEMRQVAVQVVQRLDMNLDERLQDVLVTASLDVLTDINRPATEKQAVLDRLKRAYRHYAWIGVTDHEGRVVAATDGLLVGQDVSKRPWWQSGNTRPSHGDVHDALLLANVLYPGEKEPPRFIDVAAPVQDQRGRTIGVLGAHLDWRWVSEVRDSALATMVEREVDAIVLGASGGVLLAPAQLPSAPMSSDVLARVRGTSEPRVIDWPDGHYLTVALPVGKPTENAGDLDWTVVVREPASTAFAPVQALRSRVLAWGALCVMLAITGGLLLAAWLSRPLRALAAAVGDPQQVAALTNSRRFREIGVLSRGVVA